jgi:hypothetical protein
MVEGVVDCSTGRCLPTGDVKKSLAKAADNKGVGGSVNSTGIRNIENYNS